MSSARFATRVQHSTRIGSAISKRLNFIPRRFNSSGVKPSPASASTSTPPPHPKPEKEPSSNNTFLLVAAAIAVGGGSWWAYNKYGGSSKPCPKKGLLKAENATFEDYQKVYNAIAKRLQDVDDEPDEGSYGPALVRLAWHASGTFDRNVHNGGSGAGTMRFQQEVSTGANSGLIRVRNWIDPVKDDFPWISHGDLYTLGGVTAIQELGGPTIKWRAGRVDGGEDQVPPDGRLPDASQGASHIRDLFVKRMGFTEGETVALIGAHALGRCHPQYSGFEGPWTFSPTYFTNDFFKLLRDEKWHIRKWGGPKQYEDDKTKSLMMLPADYALVQDKELKKWVDKYAADNDLFFQEFSKAFSTLLELGVNFKPNTPYYEFKRLDDQ